MYSPSFLFSLDFLILTSELAPLLIALIVPLSGQVSRFTMVAIS